MRNILYLLFVQYVIFCNQYQVINTKSMLGHNIRQARAVEFPYIVSLMTLNPLNVQSGGDHFCTGILITRKDILTSAHCLEDEILNDVQIIVGTIDLRQGQKFYPFWWISYDQWAVLNNVTLDFDLNDIANIRLLQHVPNNIYPGRLSTLENHELYGAIVNVAGWGITSTGIVPNIMETATLTILENNLCETRIERLAGERLPIDIRLLCTVASPFIVLNDGDSGGPLLFRNRLIAINKGVCPIINQPYHRNQVNIHIGIHHYRNFINEMKYNP